MNWSRREMSAESVASTNEPSSGQPKLAEVMSRPEVDLSAATSLPAYLAHTLVASLTDQVASDGMKESASAESEHLTRSTINSPSPAHSLGIPRRLIQVQQSQHDQLIPMANQLRSSPLILEQQQQSFSDWWDEYWSRQPFPSGYTQSSITLLACFISTIIFLIVVGNLLVCIAIFTEKSLKPTQNWFIASLAVSDMLLGLVVMPFSLARELMGFWVFGPLWCDIHEAIDVLLTTASINTLCLISLDRYWSITQAVSYLKKRTPRRGAFMIAFVWVFSAAVSLPPLFGWKKQQTQIMLAANKQVSASNQTGPDSTSTSASASASTPTSGPDQAPRQEPANDGLPDSDDQYISSAFPAEAHQDGQHQQRRRRHRQLSELATPVSNFPSRRLFDEQLQQLDPQTDAFITTTTTAAETTTATTMEAPVTTATATATDILGDYPTCQLSDDLGYVLYSALGSFYIPCAVMVFTYIKIFLAARSRARRAISKQGRGAGANKRTSSSAVAGRRTTASGLVAGSKPQLTIQQGYNASTISGHVNSYAGTASYNGSCNNAEEAESAKAANCAPSPVMKGGKIVIVERKKSQAALVSSSHPQQQVKAVSGSFAAIQTTTFESVSHHKQADIDSGASALAETREQPSDQEPTQCTLTTSGAIQASPSALNSSASNDSSMITVMHSSMAEIPPVTRFNFRKPGEASESGSTGHRRPAGDDDGARKAAALLEAIKQVGSNGQQLINEVLGESGSGDDDNDDKKGAVPDIVVERRGTSQVAAPTGQAEQTDDQVDEDNPDSGTHQRGDCCEGLNATNETCFMTIEEDSDMFESQTGRTITMVAGNASQRQTSNLAKNQSTIVTMMPATKHSALVCSELTCRSAHKAANTATATATATTTTTTSARSVSSYCGSSLTINDDEIDDCDDQAEDEDDPLTDECNGYSCSAAYDHYCPEQDLPSTCVHCQECELTTRLDATAASGSGTRHLSIAEGLSPTRLRQLKHHHSRQQQQEQEQQQQQLQHQQHQQHNQQQQQQQQQHQQRQQPRKPGSQQKPKSRQQTDANEVQSITGDDNISSTEYRSNEDDESSSIIGHDVLDATDSKRRDHGSGESKKKQSVSGSVPPIGERKKSSIGFRLARLGSAAPVSNYGAGLIALASGTQQQQSGGARNLKALRQNFFLKLNQLTAKSANKQQESKSKKCTSPTGGKSSAQSSGTSYEPSCDYATTSNIHSNEYPQETTIGDESEQHSSSEQAKMVKQSDEGQYNKSKDLIDGAAKGADSGHAMDLPTCARLACQSGGVKFARHEDRTGRVSTETGDLKAGGGGENNINHQMVGRISSGLVSSSKSAAAVGAGATMSKSQRFDLNNDHHPHPHPHHHHHRESATAMGGTAGAGAGSKKRPALGGYSSTIVSSSVGSGQPSGQRAYLASDNERHKRKLAKARERRATLILGLIMAAFICSWLPFFTFYVLRALCSSCKELVSPRVEAFIFWMGYCNSAINPIIYTIFNRDFRKAFRKILFKCL